MGGLAAGLGLAWLANSLGLGGLGAGIAQFMMFALLAVGIMMAVIFEGHKVFECRDLANCKRHGGIIQGEYCWRGEQHTTVIFNIFIWLQVMNEFNA